MEKDYRWLSAHRPAPFAWQAQDLHPSGAVGDATQASAEKGERLLDHGARAFCELLADVDKFDPQSFSGGPKAWRGAFICSPRVTATVRLQYMR